MSVGGNTCFVYVGVQYCRCMHFCQRWKVTKYNRVLTYAQVLRDTNFLLQHLYVRAVDVGYFTDSDFMFNIR